VAVQKIFTPILKAIRWSPPNGTDMAKLCKDEFFRVDLKKASRQKIKVGEEYKA
jgi:hypothetical protein